MVKSKSIYNLKTFPFECLIFTILNKKNMLKDMEIDKIYKRIFINAPTNCAMLLGTEKKS